MVSLPERTSSGGVAGWSSLRTRSSHQYMMSAVLHGSPSDHFRPLRKWNVHSLASAFDSQLSARPGPMSLPSLRYRRIEWPYMFWLRAYCGSLAVCVMLSVPPYLPVVSHLCGTTYGLSGSRSATFGSFPAFTCSASSGDSPKRFGGSSGLISEPFPAPVFSPEAGWSGPLSCCPPSEQAASTTAPAATAERCRMLRRLRPSGAGWVGVDMPSGNSIAGRSPSTAASPIPDSSPGGRRTAVETLFSLRRSAVEAAEDVTPVAELA